MHEIGIPEYAADAPTMKLKPRISNFNLFIIDKMNNSTFFALSYEEEISWQ